MPEETGLNAILGMNGFPMMSNTADSSEPPRRGYVLHLQHETTAEFLVLAALRPVICLSFTGCIRREAVAIRATQAGRPL
jgi:hypothetical protein